MKDAGAADKEEFERREEQRQEERRAADAAKKLAEDNKPPPAKMEVANTQTDIGMEWFDRERSVHKQDSRGSGVGSSSNKQRVGGGGAISKPPR